MGRRGGRPSDSYGPDDGLILIIVAVDVEATRCVSHEHCLSHLNIRHILCRRYERVNAPGETGKACCQEQALAGRVPGRTSERKPGLSASKETPSTGHSGEPCSTRTKTTDSECRYPSMWMLLDWKYDVKPALFKCQTPERVEQESEGLPVCTRRVTIPANHSGEQGDGE